MTALAPEAVVTGARMLLGVGRLAGGRGRRLHQGEGPARRLRRRRRSSTCRASRSPRHNRRCRLAARRCIAVDPRRARPDGDRARPRRVLRAGGLVAFPTETVYGLGAAALDAAAVAGIFAAKGRPATDPLIVHLASIGDLPRGRRRGAAGRRARSAGRSGPGPLTLIVPKRAEVPAAVTAGLATVAVRVPAHPVALALLRGGGRAGGGAERQSLLAAQPDHGRARARRPRRRHRPGARRRRPPTSASSRRSSTAP